MSDGAFVYIVCCADGSLYTGTTRTTLDVRIAQHNSGFHKGYTETRRPVSLVYAQWFERITDAIANERKIKRWSRAKKGALIGDDMLRLQQLSQRQRPHGSRRRKCASSP